MCTPGIRIRQFGRRSIWFPSALSEVEENSAPVVLACWGINRPLCDQPTQIHIWLYHLLSIYQCTDPFSHIQPTLSQVCLGSSPSSGTNSEPHRHLPDCSRNACMWLRQTIESKIDRKKVRWVKCKVMPGWSLIWFPSFHISWLHTSMVCFASESRHWAWSVAISIQFYWPSMELAWWSIKHHKDQKNRNW